MAEKHTAPSGQEDVENETERGRESDENDDIRVLKQKLDDKDQQLTKLQQELDALKKTLQEIHNQPASLDLPPYKLTVTNYKGFKENTSGVTWNSGSYYTHPGGYKFHIDVYPHTMAVYFYPEPGEYDDTLTWPARVSITIELRNQHRDQDHMEITRRLEWGHKATSFQYISRCFLPHGELEWNDKRKTEYLRNNCLRFRITKIQVRTHK